MGKRIAGNQSGETRVDKKNTPQDARCWTFNKKVESYQLALVMPGILPWEAISRRVMRERPNFR